jgi:hypothetical protein
MKSAREGAPRLTPWKLVGLDDYRRVRELDRWGEFSCAVLAVAFPCRTCGAHPWTTCPDPDYDPCDERYLRAARARAEWWRTRAGTSGPSARRRYSRQVLNALQRSDIWKAFPDDPGEPAEYLRRRGLTLCGGDE